MVGRGGHCAACGSAPPARKEPGSPDTSPDVGSGITIDSNAEDEWQELIKKSETMLNALNL